MNLLPPHYDIFVLGAGPAGQKAAVQGAKAGKRVLLVDREARAGGECVHRGTIPSKTLHERAQALLRTGGVKPGERVPIDVKMYLPPEKRVRVW